MAKKWIQKAIKNPGALRKKLGAKKGSKLTAAQLKTKKGDTTKTKRQKALARTLRKMRKK